VGNVTGAIEIRFTIVALPCVAGIQRLPTLPRRTGKSRPTSDLALPESLADRLGNPGWNRSYSRSWTLRADGESVEAEDDFWLSGCFSKAPDVAQRL